MQERSHKFYSVFLFTFPHVTLSVGHSFVLPWNTMFDWLPQGQRRTLLTPRCAIGFRAPCKAGKPSGPSRGDRSPHVQDDARPKTSLSSAHACGIGVG